MEWKEQTPHWISLPPIPSPTRSPDEQDQKASVATRAPKRPWPPAFELVFLPGPLSQRAPMIYPSSRLRPLPHSSNLPSILWGHCPSPVRFWPLQQLPLLPPRTVRGVVLVGGMVPDSSYHPEYPRSFPHAAHPNRRRPVATTLMHSTPDTSGRPDRAARRMAADDPK